MKRMVKFCLLILLPSYLLAQKDSFHLIYPLNEAIVVSPPKTLIHYDEPDLCIVLISIPDAAVKAVTNGRVTNVVQSEEEDGKWEIVFVCKFKNKEYYLWYSGITRLIVKRNDILIRRTTYRLHKTG